jgi:hypothetical protein
VAHPSQEIYTAIRGIAKGLGYDVYDGAMPDETVPYPFVYIGEASMTDLSNKSAIFGRVRQSVHVWHDDLDQRGTVTSIMLAIHQEAHRLRATPHFFVTVRTIDQSVIVDSSTGRKLYHGIVDIVLDFN